MCLCRSGRRTGSSVVDTQKDEGTGGKGYLGHDESSNKRLVYGTKHEEIWNLQSEDTQTSVRINIKKSSRCDYIS